MKIAHFFSRWFKWIGVGGMAVGVTAWGMPNFIRSFHNNISSMGPNSQETVQSKLNHPILKPDTQRWVQQLAATLSPRGLGNVQTIVLEKLLSYQTAYNQTRQQGTAASVKQLSAVTDELTLLRESLLKKQSKIDHSVLAAIEQAIQSTATLLASSHGTAQVPASSKSVAALAAVAPLPPGLSLQLKTGAPGMPQIALSANSLSAPSFSTSSAIFTGPSKLPMSSSKPLSSINLFMAKLTSKTDPAPPPATGTLTCTAAKLTDPDLHGDALNATDLFTERTTQITQLAHKLGTPEAAFQFVRDEIHFLPRFGAAQTPAQILRSGLGSSADKASLLIALLRSQGIPSHYIMGELQMNEAQLRSLYGVATATDLYWTQFALLNSYFSSSPGVFDSSRMYRFVNGVLVYSLPEVWVRAWIHGRWMQLDPIDLTQDVQLANTGLLQAPVETRLDAWLFDPDSSGQIVKPGTLVDDLMRRVDSSIRIVAGNGTSLNDVGAVLEGRSTLPVSPTLPLTSPGVLPPCIEAQANLLPPTYQFLTGVRVGPAASPAFRIKIPSRILKNPLLVRFSVRHLSAMALSSRNARTNQPANADVQCDSDRLLDRG